MMLWLMVPDSRRVRASHLRTFANCFALRYNAASVHFTCWLVSRVLGTSEKKKGEKKENHLE